MAVVVGFVAAALVWSGFAVPALVKYPTDVDVTSRYRGVFTLFVDPATAAPLAPPQQVPLDVERHIRSLGDESGASRVVVEETITQRAGDVLEATQENVYVMDRRTLENIADDRAYAFEPANIVDRSGAYRLNLPFDTSTDSTYEIYKNEIDTTYEAHAATTTPTSDVAGLRLHNFTTSATEIPLDDVYLAELQKIVALPESLTLDQLEPQLQAAGLDVDGLVAATAPVITADDLATLAQIAAEPIALQYVMSFGGTVGVETTTGAEVDVDATEWVGAKPVLADVAALQAVIAHYPDVPEAVAAGDALAALRSAPATKLFEYQYRPTPASLADVAHEVRTLRNQIRLVELYVPIGLWAGAFLSLAVVAFVSWRRRRPPIDGRTTLPDDNRASERAPASSGAPRLAPEPTRR